MKKQRSAVRSTRTWSWSGEGTWLLDGLVFIDEHPIVLDINIGHRPRSTRKVRVLVKVTEVKS